MKAKRKIFSAIDCHGQALNAGTVVVMTEAGNDRTAGLQFGIIANGTKTGAQIFSISAIQNAKDMVEERRHKQNGQVDDWYLKNVERYKNKPSHRPSHAFVKYQLPIGTPIKQETFNECTEAVIAYLYEKEEK